MILNIDDDVAEVKHVYYFGDGMGEMKWRGRVFEVWFSNIDFNEEVEA